MNNATGENEKIDTEVEKLPPEAQETGLENEENAVEASENFLNAENTNETLEEAEPNTGSGTALKKILLTYYDILDSLVFATIATMLVFFFVGRTAIIDGSSMYPTLEDGQRVILVTAFYTPKVGDMVVATRASSEFEPVAKRIIATAGQTVFIDFEEGAVYVDGQKLDEPYTNSPTNLDEGVQFPVTVPAGSVFVLGDNRNNSLDSRSPRIGFIDERNIIGEIVYKVSPFEKIEK